MTSAEKGLPKEHDALADALRDDAPRMDDLRRARLERRVLARSPGASTSQELAPIASDARVSGSRVRPLSKVGPEPSMSSRGRPTGSRWAIGALALAAAALIGFVVRGAVGPSAQEGPRFAIGSAFETREGTLANGARFELARGEEGRLEIGDVTAQLADEGSLEVRSIDPNDVRLVLERGTAELAFHPHERGRQHLRIVTPSADVEVVGTVFTVHVDDAGTSVSVREGTVRVTRRAGEPVLVHAGESVTVPRLVATAAVAPSTMPRVITPGVVTEGVVMERGSLVQPSAAGIAAAAPGITAPGITGPVAEPGIATSPISAAVRSVPAPLAFRASARQGAVSTQAVVGAPVVASAPAVPGSPAVAASTGTTTEATAVTASGATESASRTTAPRAGSASELASPVAPPAADTHAADLAAVHPRELAVDSWSAHRPSSREIAAAWHDIDDLQARGQFERSLALLVRLERYAPASDQDEALFDRARTVQEALRRPAAARVLYSEYVRRFPMGRHLQEVQRRLTILGGPVEETAPTEAAPTPSAPSE